MSLALLPKARLERRVKVEFSDNLETPRLLPILLSPLWQAEPLIDPFVLV
jgi:hypothetical protein